MKKTRICELFGIEYPIIEGGMLVVGTGELAAAISNAGGLGVISANVGREVEANLADNLRNQIRKAKSLTDKPLGVNLSLALPEPEVLRDVIIEEGIKVVPISAGNPMPHIHYLKNAGIKVLTFPASVAHAKRAEEAGVDAVIVEGCESGGHLPASELPLSVFLPQVVEAVKIPVIAAGGIADARGFVAALALGAEGIQMRTRFVATEESTAHQTCKEALVKADATETMVFLRGASLGPFRALKNELTTKMVEMEKQGASTQEIAAMMGHDKARQGILDGDVVNGFIWYGLAVGQIKEILSAGEVVRSIVEGAEAILNKL